jgi:hypothetical protein
MHAPNCWATRLPYFLLAYTCQTKPLQMGAVVHQPISRNVVHLWILGYLLGRVGHDIWGRSIRSATKRPLAWTGVLSATARASNDNLRDLETDTFIQGFAPWFQPLTSRRYVLSGQSLRIMLEG